MGKELNDGHIHEALDRLHVVISHIDNFIMEHPLIEAVDDYCVDVAEAMNILDGLYQKIGQLESIEDLSNARND